MWNSMDSWKKTLILIGLPVLVILFIYGHYSGFNGDCIARIKDWFSRRDEVELEEL